MRTNNVITFFTEYKKTGTLKTKIIDVYLAYVLVTGITQLIYALVVGSFPFNSLVSGLISTVGCFVLTGKPGFLL